MWNLICQNRTELIMALLPYLFVPIHTVKGCPMVLKITDCYFFVIQTIFMRVSTTNCTWDLLYGLIFPICQDTPNIKPFFISRWFEAVYRYESA
jgi:hypothetical protein